jgi:hypothetical protein
LAWGLGQTLACIAPDLLRAAPSHQHTPAATQHTSGWLSWLFFAIATLQTLVNEGLKGIYKGISAPLATVALFNAVLFASRGQMEVLLKHKDGTARAGWQANALSFMCWQTPPPDPHAGKQH